MDALLASLAVLAWAQVAKPLLPGGESPASCHHGWLRELPAVTFRHAKAGAGCGFCTSNVHPLCQMKQAASQV